MDCSKVGFKDKIQALTALRTIKKQDDGKDKPCRVYFCTGCKHWHLTKTSLFENSSYFKLSKLKDWKKLLK